MEFLTLSSEALSEASRRLADAVQEDFSPDVVAFIADAGYPIAKVISDAFGVPLIGVVAKRKGNLLKETISPLLLLLPDGLKNYLRRAEMSSGIHAKSKERGVGFLQDAKTFSPKRLLLVDDSVDTGHSVLAIKKMMTEHFPSAEIRVAALNVWKQSIKTVHTDYTVYEDTVLTTPMSKDSPEHKQFLKEYHAYLATLKSVEANAAAHK